MSTDTASSSSSSSTVAVNPNSSPIAVVSPNFGIMDGRTLKELAALDVSFQTMSIQYPDGQCELKSGLIHLMPKFHGLVGENPHKHLKC